MPELYGLVDAIVYDCYPEDEDGNVVADIFFRDVSPSGKLPLTFPKSVKNLPPYGNYSMKRCTYKYATAEPQFLFGFGLSYTTFEYSDLKASRKVVEVSVKNTSRVVLEEVVQLYLSWSMVGKKDPNTILVKFKRSNFAPDESKKPAFSLGE